jgi:hypothetical protein
MRRIRHGWLVLLLALAFGCAPATEPPRSPPELLVIGIVSEVMVADPERRYVLEDGRIIDATPPVRILFDGGLGQPLVLGRDAVGAFVAVFLVQDGLPPDCHLPGLGAVGIERGQFIEIEGILWRKAASFSSAEQPELGRTYEGSTRYCFDDRAEVAYTVPR